MQGVATVGSAFGLGTVAGPAIASLFTPFGLLVPFYFISVLALVSAATIWFLLPERTAPKARAPASVALKWHDRRVLPFVIFAIGLSTASTVPIQTMGFFFMDVLHAGGRGAVQHDRPDGVVAGGAVRAACRRSVRPHLGAGADQLGPRRGLCKLRAVP